MKVGTPRLAPFTPVTAPVATKVCDVYVPLASVTVTVGVASSLNVKLCD